MPKPTQAPESFSDLGFPLRGVDVSKGYGAQQPGTTPLGVNVRGYEPSSRRAKGGARPGLVPYLSQIPGGPAFIQNLNIVDPTSEDAVSSSLYDWPGLPSGGVNDPAIPSVPLPPLPPLAIPVFTFPPFAFPGLTFEWDPSSPGIGTGHTYTVPLLPSPGHQDPTGHPSGGSVVVPAPSDWGTTTVAGGINSRNPGRVVPVGGSGFALRKNSRKTKRIPNIIWANPAAVPIGTLLSSTQLNAVARDPVTNAVVAGTFQYVPPAGEAVTTDPMFLYTYFTPTDRTAYTLNTARVTIGTPHIKLVQNQAMNSILTPVFSTAVAAGSLLVLSVVTLSASVPTGGNGIPPATATGITDSLGNTWTKATERLSAVLSDIVPQDIQIRVALWYVIAPVAGTPTLTVAYSGTPILDWVSGWMSEWSGVNNSSPLVTTSTAVGTTGTASSGNLTPSGVHDLAIAAFAVQNLATALSSTLLTPNPGLSALNITTNYPVLYILDAANPQALGGTIFRPSGAAVSLPYFQDAAAIFKAV